MKIKEKKFKKHSKVYNIFFLLKKGNISQHNKHNILWKEKGISVQQSSIRWCMTFGGGVWHLHVLQPHKCRRFALNLTARISTNCYRQSTLNKRVTASWNQEKTEPHSVAEKVHVVSSQETPVNSNCHNNHNRHLCYCYILLAMTYLQLIYTNWAPVLWFTGNVMASLF